MQMTRADEELIERARAIIAKRFKEGFHHVGAALRTRSGSVFAAVHLDAYVGRIAVCAEAAAIGVAASAGDTDIDTIVAVDRHGRVLSPCGMCRELIMDYSPDCRVILREDAVVPVRDLLPDRYRKRD